MPALRFFKIGVDLDVKGDRDPAAKLVKAKPVKKSPPPEALTDRDLDAIRALQCDLAAEPEPFRALASQWGFEQDELLAYGRAFGETGQMRRYSAVLAHRNAGFVQNGMGVWKVPEERLDECGQAMAAFRGVSHCYQRPTYPDWPYNLFSMTHGRTKADCEAVLAAVGAETGLDEYSVLYSTKEYKKTRVSYFTPEEAAWEQAHAALSV
jgi:DNA-binding Lrp family transcriptional regulator